MKSGQLSSILNVDVIAALYFRYHLSKIIKCCKLCKFSAYVHALYAPASSASALGVAFKEDGYDIRNHLDFRVSILFVFQECTTQVCRNLVIKSNSLESHRVGISRALKSQSGAVFRPAQRAAAVI